MPTMHAPFVRSSSVQGTFSPHIALAVMPASSESHGLERSGRSIAAHCHAPPVSYAPATLPLRI
jgi:hypothetical protein